MEKKVLLIALLIFFLINSYSQSVRLDSSFGKNGIVRTDFREYRDVYGAEGMQVLTKSDGTIYLILVTHDKTLITHVLANGATDSAYGDNGYSEFIDVRMPAAAIQSDGKIIVVGLTGSSYSDFATARYNTNGSLDTSFSEDGKLTTDFTPGSPIHWAFASAVAVQPDGKIVVAGGYTNIDEGNQNSAFALARYNNDGSLDSTFSGDGKQTNSFFAPRVSVAVQSDGKIVVVGSDFTLARYNADGTLDSTFSEDGMLLTDFGPGYDIASSVAIQKDGKIVVAGAADALSNNSDFAVARYNPGGSLDSTFSEDGQQTTDFGSTSGDVAKSLLIQTDGRIVVTGYTGETVMGHYRMKSALARYNIDGSLDNTFSGDGKQTTAFGQVNSAESVSIQTDGKLVTAGTTNTMGESGSFDLVRYNTNGTLDNTFSKDGKVSGHLLIGYTTYNSTAIQKDGKVVVAGSTGREGNYDSSDFAIARYNTDGTLDTTFSGDGKQTTDFAAGQDHALAVAVQPDGKIVVAGNYENFPYYSNAALTRYNCDGSLDTTFSKNGKLIVDSGSAYLAATAIAIQGDGKIVVIFSSTNFGFTLFRYNSDGTLDSTFSNDGVLTTDFDFGARPTSVAIQSDGKIVVAGGITSSIDGRWKDFALARYNTDGSLDTAFSGDGKQTTSFGSDDQAYAVAIALQSDGKIVVAGNSLTPHDDDLGLPYRNSSGFPLARYNVDGTLDTSFSEDGKLTGYFGLNDDLVTSLDIASDGKILIAGTSKGNFAVTRFNKNGGLDSSFGIAGKLISEPTNGYNIINSIKIVSDNKMYVVGSGENPGNVGIVARYLFAGSSNTPPTVGLTAPTNNATYLAPAARIRLFAVAADKDDAISKVEFYNGNTLLHTETVPPYGFKWRDVPLGEYTLTAKAYDNSDNVATSAAVHIFVVPNKPPTVSIVAPANNEHYAAPAYIHFEAAASDTDGRITRVEFYNGSTLLRTEYKYPYTCVLKNVPPGTYTITAVATDNWGAQTTSDPITVKVKSRKTIVSSRSSFEDNNANLSKTVSLNLYPNPVKNIVHIYLAGMQLNKQTAISVTSVSGIALKGIQTGSSTQTIQVDVSSLAKGAYIIKIVSGDRVEYGHFLKL